MTYIHTFRRNIRAKSNLNFVQAGGTLALVPSNPAADRNLSIIDPGGNDAFLFAAATQTISNKTLGSNLAAGSNKITGLANGTASGDAVNFSQLQAHTAGLKPFKTNARLTTTANITLANEQTIDGVAAVEDDIVLVKNQTDKSENGPYVVVDGGSWVRHTDFDGPEDVPPAGLIFLFVSEGDTQANTGWLLTTDLPYTIGSDDLEFSQFTGGGSSYVEGDGIDISGNVISAVGTSGRIDVSGGTIDIDAAYVGQTSITTLGTISSGTWNATPIGTTKGGTGATSASAGFNALSPMTTLGDSIYGGASGAGTRLAGNTDATKKYLSQTGNGTTSAAPAWSQPAFSEISGVATIAQGGTGETTAEDALAALGGEPIQKTVLVKTNSDHTFVGDEMIVLFEAGSSNRAADIPEADASNIGKVLWIGKVSGTGNVTVTPDAGTVNNGDANFVIDDNELYMFISNGDGDWLTK